MVLRGLGIVVAMSALLGLANLPSVAWAEGGRAAAKRAYAEGKRRYDIGEYEAALEAFKRAYLAHEDPVLLYNIAQCHRQLGHGDDALQAYKSFLRKVPQAPNRAEVEAHIAKIEKDQADAAEAKAKAAREAELARNPPPPTTPAVELAATAPKPETKKPLYKKWWLWTVVGGVAAAGVAVGVGVGVGLGRRPTEPALPNVGL